MFYIEIMSTFKMTKSHLKQSYDKQNHALLVISYEIYETRQRFISDEMYENEMTTTASVRSSVYLQEQKKK